MSDRSEHPPYPETPDGRYFVVRGRLWRKSNPALDDDLRQRLVKALMRRAMPSVRRRAILRQLLLHAER